MFTLEGLVSKKTNGPLTSVSLFLQSSIHIILILYSAVISSESVTFVRDHSRVTTQLSGILVLSMIF